MLIILLCMIGVLMLVGTKVRPVGFFDDYISADKSQYIKGVFILMVFLSHSLTYIDRADLPAIDSYYLQFRFYMGQMIVAPFLFMSGYGSGKFHSCKRETIHSNNAPSTDFDGPVPV